MRTRKIPLSVVIIENRSEEKIREIDGSSVLLECKQFHEFFSNFEIMNKQVIYIGIETHIVFHNYDPEGLAHSTFKIK